MLPLRNRFWARILFSLASLFIMERAWAFTCSESCKDQCRDRPYWQKPACQGQCNTWRVANCVDLSDPLASAVGEIGAAAYVEASNTISARAADRARRNLNAVEKKILRQFFGSLVDEVTLYFEVPLMDSIGRNGYYIDLNSATAQTYGKHIYFEDRETYWYIDFVTFIEVLGHELVHSQQYVNRGSSLARFGRDYFYGWERAGFSYANNPMEKEAHNQESKFGNAAQKYLDNGGTIIQPDRNRFSLTCIYNDTKININYNVKWGNGDWKQYSVKSGSWRSHYHTYEFLNQNRSPQLLIRFDYDLSSTDRYKQYSLRKFASPHTDCDRQAQRERFQYTNGKSQLELYHYGSQSRSYAMMESAPTEVDDEDGIFYTDEETPALEDTSSGGWSTGTDEINSDPEWDTSPGDTTGGWDTPLPEW